MESYKIYVSPFFDKYNNLKAVEKELNTIPYKRSELILNIEKRIMTSLVLFQKYSNDSFEAICKSYENYILNSQHVDKENHLAKFILTLDYLEKNEINLPD